MQPLPCRTLDQEALDTAEMAFRGRRERIRWSLAAAAMLLLLSLGHMYYAFWFYPAQKAEEFQILNREKKDYSEGGEGGVERPDLATPAQANKVFAGIIFALVLAGGAALLYFAYRDPVPAVEHSPGPVEESMRPGYGAGAGTLANPWVVRMYYIRCRDCGRTLKQWELRQRTTPAPRKRR